MSMELFEKLYNEGNYLDAYLVGKNLFNKHCENMDVFKAVFSLGLKLASFDITFEERKEYLNEASNMLSIFSDNVKMNEEAIELIKISTKEVGKIYVTILNAESDYYEKKRDKVVEHNSKLLQKLAEEHENLKRIKTQKEFDEKLTKITELEVELEKEAFTEKQQCTYDVLTKHFSETISKKMEELNNLELVEINKKAVKSFKQVYDTFISQKNRYKDSESNLKALVMNTFFVYDSRQLFNETLIYYNHIYSMIFNEVNDQLKYKLTEWSILATKIKR